MNIRTDISQRTTSDIRIRYYNGGLTTEELYVPITPQSKRVFRLMSEDYIELVFSLPNAIHFNTGDYIYDVVWGYFYINDEQMPRYNQQTGGYDYTLRFDAPYLRWRRFLFMLVANVYDEDIAGYANERMETDWKLTAPLATHAEQIVENLEVLGFDGYTISVTAEKAAEVHYLQYSGVNIIEAMNMIADAWECEWWVEGSVIHFGKCGESDSATAFEMTLADNVESMDISRDQQTFCNRLYAYGGTKNIPENYDSHLLFTADDVSTPSSVSSLVMKDSHNKLTDEMIVDTIDGATTIIPNEQTEWNTVPTSSAYSLIVRSVTVQPDTYTLDGLITAKLVQVASSSASVSRVNFSAKLGNVSLGTATVTSSAEDIDGNKEWVHAFQITYPNLSITTASTIDITIMATPVSSSSLVQSDFSLTCSKMLAATGTSATRSKRIAVEWNGTTYEGIFNPYHKTEGDSDYYYIGSLQDNGTYIGSDGFAAGEEFTIPLEWLNITKIPYSFYTADYDTGGLSKIGERRLHLPSGTRYITPNNGVYPYNYNEMAVIFEDEFPRLELRIKSGSIITETITDTIVHDDKSVSYENWTQYQFQAQSYDGTSWNDYIFNLDWMLDQQTLQAVFTAPTEQVSSGFKLSGMTFDVDYSNGYFKIVRNDNYGTSVPNNVLVPSDNDTFFLTGWNPRAIGDMGLVTEAERRLRTRARAYLAAIAAGQFSFTCRMMSDTMMSYPFVTDIDGDNGYDTNGLRRYGLLNAGCKVTINHDALPNGSKTSRVIGYECKLDIPYDTPTYIVGETEAYSRLKQIEKQLTKL